MHCRHGCPSADIYAELKARGLYRKAAARGQGQNTGVIFNPIPLAFIPSNTSNLGAFRVRAPLGFKPVKLWWYCNAEGEPVFGMVRFDAQSLDEDFLRQPNLPSLEVLGKIDKTFRPLTLWQRPGAEPKWYLKAAPKPWPLYNLPAIVGNPNATIIVTEGEKCAKAAAVIFPQHACVSPAYGAASPAFTDWTAVKDRTVEIWPDNDPPGEQFARHVTALCRGATKVSAKDMSQWPLGYDLADILADARREGKL